jgi:hypothetical protein
MFSTDPARTSPASRGSQPVQPAAAPPIARRIAVDGVSGALALSLIGFATADLINPDWSPAEAMISHYVHAPHGGWLIPVGTLMMAVASGTLTWLVAAYTRGGRAGIALLGVWTAGLLVAGGFPTDPPGQWDKPPTTAGTLHGVAALLAFATLTAAAVVLSRVWRRDPRWRPVAGGLAVTTALVVAAFALFMITFFDVQGGPALAVGPWSTVTGLAERVMMWANVGWLAVAAAGLRRITREG